MYISLVLGVVGAIDHNTFYTSVNGSEATDQLRMLRYGAALVYLTKSLFATSIMLAFRRQIWETFHRNLLAITAIDDLFAASIDIYHYFI
jgi:hypothetical protein